MKTRTDQSGVVTTYEYDRANRLEARRYGDGQGDDADSRLAQAASARYSNAVARTYTPRDQLASVSFGGAPVVASFIYDDEDRLTGWQRDGAGDTQTRSPSKVGDRKSTTIGTAGILPATETRTHNAVH